MKLINQTIRILKKSSIYMKIIILLIVLYVIYKFAFNKKHLKEGFTQQESFITKHDDQIFDEFYVNIYDKLMYEPIKNKYELGEIVLASNMQPSISRVLDIGSGTGNYLRVLHHNKVDVIGLEKSPNLVEKSLSKYPDIDVMQGDYLDSMLFSADQFTHINCLDKTIYDIKNKSEFFYNCFKWLMPGGYLSLHLVNKDKFNPILRSANPLLMVSPQKYAKNRITTSIIKFNDFHYKGDFKYKNGDKVAYFEETFKDDNTNKVRKNIRTMYVDSQKHILSLAKQAGFILKDTIDLINCQHEYEYVYILYKPE